MRSLGNAVFWGKLRMYVTAGCENPDASICLLESNTVLSNLMMLLYGNSVTTDCPLLFTDFEN